MSFSSFVYPCLSSKIPAEALNLAFQNKIIAFFLRKFNQKRTFRTNYRKLGSSGLLGNLDKKNLDKLNNWGYT